MYILKLILSMKTLLDKMNIKAKEGGSRRERERGGGGSEKWIEMSEMTANLKELTGTGKKFLGARKLSLIDPPTPRLAGM